MTKCATCNHERSYHYWLAPYGIPHRNCAIKDCDCSGYKLQTFHSDPNLEQNQNQNQNQNQKTCVADVIGIYIKKVLDDYNITEDGRQKADELYKNIRGETLISGRNPRVLAGQILYLALNECGLSAVAAKSSNGKITQEDIRNSLNITSIGGANLDQLKEYYFKNGLIQDPKFSHNWRMKHDDCWCHHPRSSHAKIGLFDEHCLVKNCPCIRFDVDRL